ncbi:MAG: arsenate reductase ArsC [Candidatus Eisenbacteria bacterium]|nr:arsenate reductase ArsC [Candidatus Eisenbacteria bacterium]MCC7140796.1 arsenate reductase ArsC [Candidatus Eisenbacteria bacterium]
MAEGWSRALRPTDVEPYSAGIEAHGLNPRAVVVMREVGVEIGEQRSRRLPDLLSELEQDPAAGWWPDLVVTVCDHASGHCPAFPGKVRRIHHGFDDPPRLAEGAGSEEEALEPYRRVRDEIREFVLSLPTPDQFEREESGS